MKNIYKLKKENYAKVAPLIKSQNELSVISTINGIMPGEIYVNDINNPTATFIKTCECNYIAGKNIIVSYRILQLRMLQTYPRMNRINGLSIWIMLQNTNQIY